MKTMTKEQFIEKKTCYVPRDKNPMLLKVPKYKGLKGEYTKTKQGKWMKVHPLDRI